MLKRSLNTYMNAWTGSDFTMYPFSTQNEKDFSNLLSVYLDASFFPKLNKLDFLQEGHRLELSEKREEQEEDGEESDSQEQENSGKDVLDGEKRLTIKGVVYNEMKGAMSDLSSIFSHMLQSELYTTTTYHHNSGGEPSEIPKLTYEELLEFHRTHYHPSNSFFFTYGDLPMRGHLTKISQHVLSKFSRLEKLETQVMDEKRFQEPRKVVAHAPYQPHAPPEQSSASVGWLLRRIDDPFYCFSMHVLSELLTDPPNGPLYKELLDSGFGKLYAPGTGFEAHLREANFSAGVQGVSEEDAERLEEKVLATLQEVAKTGFPPERIHVILHQLEISQRHVTTNFGLNLVSAIISPWMHFGTPLPSLRLSEHVERLKQEISRGPFFEELVRKELLENPHRVTLLVHPDRDYGKRLEREENSFLQKLESSIGEEERREIERTAEILKQRQMERQDNSCLPTLTMRDIPWKKERTRVEHFDIGSISLSFCPQPTNGMCYVKALMDLSHLPDHLQPYLPLFSSLLTSIGNPHKNYNQLCQEIDLYTGGISASPSVISDPTNANNFKSALHISTSALERNSQKMLDLLIFLFSSTDFSYHQQFLSTQIQQSFSSLQNEILNSGHYFASKLVSADFNKMFALAEKWKGISQFSFLKQVVAQGEQNFDCVVSSLSQILRYIVSNSSVRLLVNAEPKFLANFESSLQTFVSQFPHCPNKSTREFDQGFILPKHRVPRLFVPVASQVNYVATGSFTNVSYTNPEYATLKVLSEITSSVYLHKEVREKGGAYGGFSSFDKAVLTFASYRDPHVEETVETFRGASEWIKKGEITQQDIDEARLSIFSSIDAPVSPGSKGSGEWMHEISHEMASQNRERLLSVEKDDILRVGAKYFDSIKQRPLIAVVGNENQRQQFENQPDWEIIDL